MQRNLLLAAVAAAGASANATNSFEFYGGNLDGRNGLANEHNTIVSDAWVFDDFDHNGQTITGLKGNFLASQLTAPTGDFAIYSGMSAGNFGTLVASGEDLGIAWTRTGRSTFGLPEYTLRLSGLNIELAAGRYHLGVRPHSDGTGRAFLMTTSGAASVGSPISNGNSFFQSGYFDIPNPRDVQGIFDDGIWDFSFGVQVVPEPAAVFVLAAGLAALAARPRRM